MPVLSKPFFHNEKAAFDNLESGLWPEAPVCPHCGSVNAKRLGCHVDINASETFFSIVKRGIVGTDHSVSDVHLDLYFGQVHFRYHNRAGLGCDDQERALPATTSVKRKRLTHRQPDKAVSAL